MNTRAELERHETMLITLLRSSRELQRLQDQHSQAILDLDAALREAQARQELALPSPPAPASQNARPILSVLSTGEVLRPPLTEEKRQRIINDWTKAIVPHGNRRRRVLPFRR